MSGTDVPGPVEHAEPTWGLGDALGGWAAAIVLAAVGGAFIIAGAGYAHVDQKEWPLWLVSIANIPLWIGLAGSVVYAAQRKGRGLVADFGFRLRAIDLPIGAAAGAVSQFVLVPALSIPWVKLLGRDVHELDDVAKNLTDKAHHSVWGVVLLVVFVAIAAPIVEELFYRGLLFRALERRFGLAWAVVGSGVIFGASHFELLQFPALAAFGMVLAYLVHRTGRLGTSICAHMTFNAITVFALVR